MPIIRLEKVNMAVKCFKELNKAERKDFCNTLELKDEHTERNIDNE